MEITLKKADDTTQVYRAGKEAEDLIFSNGIPGGDRLCSFKLKRALNIPMEEIKLINQIILDHDMRPCFTGRIHETPREIAGACQWEVNGLGMYASMKDIPIRGLWIVSDITKWADRRRTGTSDANAYQDNSGNFAAELGAPGTNSLVIRWDGEGGQDRTADIGQYHGRCFVFKAPGTVKLTRIVSDWETYFLPNDVGGSTTGLRAQILAYDGTTWTTVWTTASTDINLKNGTINEALPANTEEIVFRFWNSSGTFFGYYVVMLAMRAILTNPKIYGTTLSGSIYVSDVIKNILPSFPEISADYTDIATTAQAISNFAFEKRTEGTAIFEEANKYHQYLMGVQSRKLDGTESTDGKPVFSFQPVDLTNIHYTTDLSSAKFSDSGLSIENIFNKVYVSYKAADGTEEEYEATDTDSNNYLNKNNKTKAAVIEIPGTTEAEAIQAATEFFVQHRRPKAQGTVEITGDIRDIDGWAVSPAHIRAGKNIHVRGLQAREDLYGAQTINGQIAFYISHANCVWNARKTTLTLDDPVSPVTTRQEQYLTGYELFKALGLGYEWMRREYPGWTPSIRG